MEEKKELQELLERLDESNRKQANYAKWQCVFSVAAAISCVGLFVLIWILMPEVRNLTQQMETVLTNLELVTSRLAGMDLGAMVQNVDELVVTTREGLGAIDFKMLNLSNRISDRGFQFYENVEFVFEFACEDEQYDKHYFRAVISIPNTKDFVGDHWKVTKVG